LKNGRGRAAHSNLVDDPYMNLSTVRDSHASTNVFLTYAFRA
jgi:hypothetical protein